MQPEPVERIFVPIAWPRMLTGAAVALAVAAAVLAGLSLLPAAVAALSLSVASLAASTTLDGRSSLRLLRSQRTAQQAGYERMRQILTALEALQTGAAARQVPVEAAPQMDARSDDVLHLISGASARSRVLLIGGPLPEVVPGATDAVDAVEPGSAALPAVPHGMHTHVLIEPATLARCDPDEIRWLRRAFRWQHDTVIAIPTRSGAAGLEALGSALGAPLATERRDRVLAVWAPFGGGSDWGRA